MCPTKKPSKLVREFSASSESRFARSFVRTLVEGADVRMTDASRNNSLEVKIANKNSESVHS